MRSYFIVRSRFKPTRLACPGAKLQLGELAFNILSLKLRQRATPACTFSPESCSATCVRDLLKSLQGFPDRKLLQEPRPSHE